MAPIFRAQFKKDPPLRKYQSGEIDQICLTNGLPRPFARSTDFVARDHACSLEDPTKPCSTAKFNTCTDGTLENACSANGIAIFTRIAPKKGYYINARQYWCDGTEILD